jgi:hypothetical protein
MYIHEIRDDGKIVIGTDEDYLASSLDVVTPDRLTTLPHLVKSGFRTILRP